MSEKYVHPSPEALERAFERLEELNEKAKAKNDGKSAEQQPPATISATP